MIVAAVLYQTGDVSEDVGRIAESLENVQITWATGLAALTVFVLGIVAARLARRAIRNLGERTNLASPETFKLSARIVFYAIAIAGASAALGVVGFDVLPLLSTFGIVAIVVAIGLQPFIENFAAGVTLQTRRPFEAGDQVRLMGAEGTVRDITARTVVVESLSGELVHLPNRKVLDDAIVVFTAHPTRRSTLDVGLDYGSDLAQAERVMRQVVATTPGVAAEPAVAVYFHEFGDSTINASIWFWHAPTFLEAWAARHQVAINVKRALDDEGMTIAFPQRVLWRGDEPAEVTQP